MNLDQAVDFIINVSICAVVLAVCIAVVMDFIKDLFDKGSSHDT